jgi:hypothetical protein
MLGVADIFKYGIGVEHRGVTPDAAIQEERRHDT